MILDASADAGKAVDAVASQYAGHLPIRCLPGSPTGLTSQRNLGLSLVQSDIVHFLDDDVILDSEYFKIMNEIFESNQDIAGATGFIRTQHEVHPSWASRLFLLSAPPGRVNAAGRNSLMTRLTNPDAPFVPVDWLSGCAMSYRVSYITGLHFDERLPGYGLGEDLWFSTLVRQRGKLVLAPKAYLWHGELAEIRGFPTERLICDISHRRVFVAENKQYFQKLAYWWSVLGLVCITLGKKVAVTLRRRADSDLRVSPLVRAALACLGAQKQQLICPCAGDSKVNSGQLGHQA